MLVQTLLATVSSGAVREAAWILGGALVLASVLSVILKPLLRHWLPNLFSYDPGLFQALRVENNEVVILNTRNGSLWKVPRSAIQDLNPAAGAGPKADDRDMRLPAGPWRDKFRL